MEMNQYLDMFIEEAKEHLQSINRNLLVLESETDNLSVVQEIFRSAHTLKGMSATMGFEDMANLTHEMENVLDLIRNHKLSVDSRIMDTIFKGCDLLEEILHSIIEGNDGKKDVSGVVAHLRAIISGEPLPKDQQKASVGIESNSIFNEYELTILSQSLESGYSIYHIAVELQKDTVLKAVRAYMVFDALESMGEVIKSNPSSEDLEAEKFDFSFEIFFISKHSAEEIEKAILNISEIKAVTAKIYSDAHRAQQEVAAAQTVEAIRKDPNDSKEKPAEAVSLTQKKVQQTKTIRVDINRLETLMNLFSELVIDRGRLEQISNEMDHPTLRETVEHIKRISGEMQNIILNLRMVPIEQVFNRFPRMVRDLARDLNKKVNLIITGSETELDRTVIDEIGDPLVHLLRNAVDHGLEPESERIAKGKPPEGKLELKAYHSGNNVFIDIVDDGNGINREKVLKKAVGNGLISEAEAEKLSDEQVYQFLFASGFSTANTITDISGRGVGLDVVKTKIESLGGSIHITSKLGVGTTFSIQLPLTLSIITAMLVYVGNEKYAIPLTSILETAVVKKDQILNVHKQEMIDFRGRLIPLISLKSVLQVEEGTSDDTHVSLVIIQKADKLAALIVDSFIGQQEIVLKSLGKYIANCFAISGATILGDGHVALIIDPNALIK